MADLENEKKWAEHQPSEGENQDNAMQNRTREGVDATARRFEGDANAAPASADPKTGETYQEYIKDAREYDEAEEKFARGEQNRAG